MLNLAAPGIGLDVHHDSHGAFQRPFDGNLWAQIRGTSWNPTSRAAVAGKPHTRSGSM